MDDYRLGVEKMCVFGMPPVDFVNLAADLGCRAISAGMASFTYSSHNPSGYVPFSLREDAALRREMMAAMRDRDVAISLGEGCVILPGRDIRDAAADMDIFRELGTERLNTVSMDPDQGRTLDQLGLFAEMAAERGMASTIELTPTLTINSLGSAVASVRHVGRPDFGLLLDTMHLGRTGVTGAQVAALDPAMIGYVQLCDAPRVPSELDYIAEATSERMVPGEGEMPLRDYLAAVQPGLTVSVEVPLLAQAAAGIPPEVRVGRCVEATKRLIEDRRGGTLSPAMPVPHPAQSV